MIYILLVFILCFPSIGLSEELRFETLDTYPTTYRWIVFQKGLETIAYVDDNCKIIIKKKKVGKYIRAELNRYKGLCLDLKQLEKEQ